MATGDLQNSIRRLQAELKACKYAGDTDVRGLISGNPSSLLPLLHFGLVSYSYPLALHLSNRGYNLSGKSDARFVDSMYKLLRDEFDFIPRLTKAQMLSGGGFAEHKCLLACQVLKLCRQHHTTLTRNNGSAIALASKPKTVSSLARSSAALPSENIPAKASKASTSRIVPARTKGQPTSFRPRQPMEEVDRNTTHSPEVRVEEHFGQSSAEFTQPLVADVSAGQELSGAAPRNPRAMASARALLSLYPRGSDDFESCHLDGEKMTRQSAGPFADYSSSNSGLASSESLPAPAMHGWVADTESKASLRHPAPAGPESPPYSSLSQPMPNSSLLYSSHVGGVTGLLPTAKASAMPSSQQLRQSSTLPASSAAPSDLQYEAPLPASSAPRPSVSVIRSRFSPPESSNQFQCNNVTSRAASELSTGAIPTYVRHDAQPVASGHDSDFRGPHSSTRADKPFLGLVGPPAVHSTAAVSEPGDPVYLPQTQQPKPGMLEQSEASWHPSQPGVPAQHREPSSTSGSQSSLTDTHYALQSHVRPGAQQVVQDTSMQPQQHPPVASSSTPSLASSIVSTTNPLPSTQAPEVSQMMLQMNAMSAQLGFVSTQLSQLLLADRPVAARPALPLSAAPSEPSQSAVASGAVVVAGGQNDVCHALETIQARLVLMETRMQRLEGSDTTPGQPPHTATVVADRSIEWRTSTASQPAVFHSQPPPSVPSHPASTEAPPRPQDISFSRSVAHSVTVQQSPCSVGGIPTQSLNHATRVSTVDISYVFSDPSTQAFVSGLKNRVKETRRVLTQLSDGSDTDGLSSSLQQQLILASASTSALSTVESS